MAKNIDAKLKNIQGIFSNSQDSILGKVEFLSFQIIKELITGDLMNSAISCGKT